MNPYKFIISIFIIAVSVVGCTSMNAAAKDNYNIKYFGKCGALYNGDKLVTLYSSKSGKTTGYAIGVGCRKSHPDAARVGFSIYESLQIEGFFVRGVKTKDGVTRRTIIRKEGGRYNVRSSK